MKYQNINTGDVVHAKRLNTDNIGEIIDFLILNNEILSGVEVDVTGDVGDWVVINKENDGVYYVVANELFQKEYKEIEQTAKCKDCEFFWRFGEKKKIDGVDGDCAFLAALGRDAVATKKGEGDNCARWELRKASNVFRENLCPCILDDKYEPKCGCENIQCISCAAEYWLEVEEKSE